MVNIGKILNIQKFRYEGDKIYAFRPKPDRFLCFFSRKKEYSSTYERLIHEDLNFEKDLNKKYEEFILSDLLLSVMEEDHISIG